MDLMRRWMELSEQAAALPGARRKVSDVYFQPQVADAPLAGRAGGLSMNWPSAYRSSTRI